MAFHEGDSDQNFARLARFLGSCCTGVTSLEHVSLNFVGGHTCTCSHERNHGKQSLCLLRMIAKGTSGISMWIVDVNGVITFVNATETQNFEIIIHGEKTRIKKREREKRWMGETVKKIKN